VYRYFNLEDIHLAIDTLISEPPDIEGSALPGNIPKLNIGDIEIVPALPFGLIFFISCNLLFI
jgi:hypothetical protein